MTDLRTAAQQALEALEEAASYTSCPTWSPSMTKECEAAAAALRAALAEPVRGTGVKLKPVFYASRRLDDEEVEAIIAAPPK